MADRAQLNEALALLGELLASRGHAFDLLVIGGGALLLQDLISRPTMDLDAMARLENGQLQSAKPLPPELVEAIRDVADTLGLPREPTDEKDWLNGGPTMLRTFVTPEFVRRARIRTFDALTIRIAAREDLITLKLWAAADAGRGARRSVDLQDLKDIAPMANEMRAAVVWCVRTDGRPDCFEQDLAPLLVHDPEELAP
jgi:hypothetical protein